jgi:flavin-binding protein dodecin
VRDVLFGPGAVDVQRAGTIDWTNHGPVSVQKAIDLTGSGETIQDAVSEALDRARESLQAITSFEVQRISGVVGESSTTYQVEIKVWFTLLERMHG